MRSALHNDQPAIINYRFNINKHERFTISRLFALVVCSSAQAGQYVQTNIVSDVPGIAPDQPVDPALKNPWGVSFSSTSPFWISSQESNAATLYNALANRVKQALVVTMSNVGNVTSTEGAGRGHPFPRGEGDLAPPCLQLNRTPLCSGSISCGGVNAGPVPMPGPPRRRASLARCSRPRRARMPEGSFPAAGGFPGRRAPKGVQRRCESRALAQTH